MKKLLLPLLLTTCWIYGFGTNFTINNDGFTFSPATITITQNDEITFTLASIHNAVEVSQGVWDANGSSPVIGFNIPFGGGTLSGSQLSIGTHYYVCTNHVAFGMKGIIIVESSSGIEDHKIQDEMSVYPNPAKENITFSYNPATSNVVEIKLFNIQGKLVTVLLPRTTISGLFLQTFPLDNLVCSGLYFIQISSNKTIVYKKIIIV
ncbi:MAG: T9SS type A sorting domain-containing protein [Bacteroidota bacterium]|nr:T9SS type A sorting domain-containing protein [Bacteroidota bacterium]